MKAFINWSCFVTESHGFVVKLRGLFMIEGIEEHQIATYQHVTVRQMKPGLHGFQQCS